MKSKNIFSKSVIGMIHVTALPGTPKFQGDVRTIISTAVTEALVYKNCGVDAIMIENMHDIPYLNNNAGPEITAMMAIIAHEVKTKTNLPVGIQILAAVNKEAIAVAHSANLDFIRTEGFVFAHIADEGIIESNAGELMRYRKYIGADEVLIFTDIKKKHSSHFITSDVSIAETAKAAEFFLSDGLILTGKSTGKEVDITELELVKNTTDLPIIIGSGITCDNITKYFNFADAFIVGSHFKIDGNWANQVDKNRIKKFIRIFDKQKLRMT